ncbi:MAG TPA: aminodeoxychorismate synthase component I [Povalibacter sp.]|uniref:aminodeoxychorismate synthase component I n=1 Tax=Povalibacter sp. TaxID=1962978 RepID=UPI002BF1DC39|nr:aminodeoxychorismate synthase component I [Povalibacter sp.]HMN43304.1 aminodeoxychorismate synthase component I [Povalibacter sp.]
MSAAPAVRPVSVSPTALLDLHAANPRRYPALFESAAAAEPLGRFDILFAFPGERLTLQSDQRLSGGQEGTFLAALDAWWSQERAARVDSALPFHGGWLVYLGYELAAQIEPRLRLPRSAGSIAQAVRIPAGVIHRRDTGQGWIVAEAASASLLDVIEADLAAARPASSKPQALIDSDVVEDAPSDYLDTVARALDYIAAGDIYQVNLSRGWHARLRDGVTPVHLYERLRRTNPGPFCGLAVLDDIAIVSSSPERLVAVRDRIVETRPIAGTRPRGRDSQSDANLIRELHAHPKERAEHVMLIDLERNDLGRICEAGSVQVDEFMTIESYEHVHHIVSNVRGRLRDDITPGQVLAAVFPGGTITGCPKVRCMEIIAELERTPRGAYTGSLGYLNRDGSMDFNILIRSLEVRGNRVSLRAGAGVVADSIPERELDESRAKARGVLRALTEIAQ